VCAEPGGTKPAGGNWLLLMWLLSLRLEMRRFYWLSDNFLLGLVLGVWSVIFIRYKQGV
jgi:hypothetical protein